MYIILSTTLNYKGKLVGAYCITRATTIGHEIHITRPILLFLLSNNLISIDDTIVTKNNERFFLYTEIFKNIIEYDSLPNDINTEEILDITHMNSLFEERYNFHFKIDLEEKFPILKKIRTNEVDIKSHNLFSKIKYIQLTNITKNYICIHHRYTHYSHMNLLEGIDIINNFLNNFSNLNIIVFTVLEPELFCITSDRITFTSRIDQYASYINNENCKAVITPFSGGGQLAQLCHNKNIFYYNNGGYKFFPDYQDIEQIIIKANDKNNIYSFFDLKKITDCNIFVFRHSNDVLNYIINNPEVIFNNKEINIYKRC